MSTLPEISSPELNRPNASRLGLVSSASEPTILRDGPQRKKGSAAARAAFLERQAQHSSVEARKNISILHKQLVHDGRVADDVEFLGAQGKEGFRQYLEKKFGSIVAGWRVLDKDKSGRLSFYELVNACRHMGYHGNLKKLWADLDANTSGFVSIMEIDPEVGHYVGTYKLALLKKYGDMLTAWRKGIDRNGTFRIEEKEIFASVEELGLDLDPKKLFKMLISGPKGLGLSLAEFDPDAWNKWSTGDHQGLILKSNKEFLDDMPGLGTETPLPDDVLAREHGIKGGAREFRNQLHAKERKEHFDALAHVHRMKAGLHTVDGFKQALIGRCGSLLQGWRSALDLDGNGRITFGEFCQALHRLGFFGDVKGLWKQLDKHGTGYLVFSELDPETDASLTELREKMTDAYGNMLVAWLKVLDVKGNGLVPEQQFVKACAQVGFTRDAKALFHVLQPSRNRAFLTLKDFDNRAYLALSRGDFRMLTEQDSPSYGGKRALELNFDERQEAGFFYQIRRAWEASRRAEFAKACRAEVHDRIIDTPEEFEELCKRKFGTLTAAWRICLDADANGRLTFNEFCQALRRLGYAGDFKALWKHYDADKSGALSLKEIDPHGHEVIRSFLELLNGMYGDLDAAWKFGFNKDPHDSIDEKELTEACKALGYTHDAGELFKNLQPMPGRVLLTIWDIDPECTRKRARGQVPYISEPKSCVARTGPRPAFGQDSSSVVSAFSSGGGNSANPGDVAHSPQQQLRLVLRLKHGSTPAAWRAALDPEMQGTVSFGKFLIIVEHCGFSGNVKRLWEELTCGRATATFRDIDPEACGALEKFRELLVGKFGNLREAWEEGLDIDGLGRIDEVEFVAAVEALGVGAKQGKRLFRLILTRPGQRSLTCDDLQALLIGVPGEQVASIWAGQAQGQGQVPATSSTSPARALPPSRPGSPKVLADHLSPRSYTEKVTGDHHAQDVAIRSVDRFKQMLIVKYGSLWAAWRRLLDVDKNGVMTQIDFARACQFLGVKEVRSLWGELDTSSRGQLSLKDVDPEVAELFAELEHLVLEKFPSTKEGWRKTFDPEKKLRCDLATFQSGCIRLGFKGRGKGSVERFFKLLRPEPGRPYIMYEDLWTDHDPNAFGSPPSPPAPG